MACPRHVERVSTAVSRPSSGGPGPVRRRRLSGPDALVALVLVAILALSAPLSRAGAQSAEPTLPPGADAPPAAPSAGPDAAPQATPSTPSPAPSTSAPSTAAPSTAAPSTAAPSTAAPSTGTPAQSEGSSTGEAAPEAAGPSAADLARERRQAAARQRRARALARARAVQRLETSIESTMLQSIDTADQVVVGGASAEPVSASAPATSASTNDKAAGRGIAFLLVALTGLTGVLAVYGFVFAGRYRPWPAGHGVLVGGRVQLALVAGICCLATLFVLVVGR